MQPHFQLKLRSANYLLCAGTLLILLCAFKPQIHASDPPNILFVVFDDLNDWVGPLQNHPGTITPNLDRLAAQGVSFINAHADSSACNPSRASLLTGLRPTTLGVVDNWSGNFRDKAKGHHRITLPAYFSRHGYLSHASGKIFHADWMNQSEWDTRDIEPSFGPPNYSGYGPDSSNPVNYEVGGIFDWADIATPRSMRAVGIKWSRNRQPIF